MDLDEGDYFDETLPYAEAGMVVVSYSIDGPMGEDEDDVGAAYEQFRAAGAGSPTEPSPCGWRGKKLPFVNPDKIFSAGTVRRARSRCCSPRTFPISRVRSPTHPPAMSLPFTRTFSTSRSRGCSCRERGSS